MSSSFLQWRNLLDSPPFCINNLLDLVQLLSDPNTPLETRLRFVRLNAIPGAQVVDEMNPVLANLDEIIPADYDIETIRRDFMLVSFRHVSQEWGES